MLVKTGGVPPLSRRVLSVLEHDVLVAAGALLNASYRPGDLALEDTAEVAACVVAVVLGATDEGDVDRVVNLFHGHDVECLPQHVLVGAVLTHPAPQLVPI